MAHKHACLRHVLVAGETVSAILRRSSPFTVSDRHGRSLMFRHRVVVALRRHNRHAQTHPRRHADYSYNFSASAELCGITNRACISPSSRWRITFRWPARYSGNACLRRKSGADRQRQLDEVMPLIAQERVTHVALVPGWRNYGCRPGSGKTATFRRCRHSGRRRPARPDAC